MEGVLTSIGSHGLLKGQNIKARKDLSEVEFLYMTVAASIIIVAVVFVYVWCRLTVVGMGYDISRLNSERAVLVEQNKRLRVNVEKLKSPQRIEALALGRLGLVYPTGNRIKYIR